MTTCKTCAFYKPNPLQPGIGTCRYNPPTLVIVIHPQQGPQTVGDFPPVQETAWCRCYQVRLESLS
jgi:hypothetical protein